MSIPKITNIVVVYAEQSIEISFESTDSSDEVMCNTLDNLAPIVKSLTITLDSKQVLQVSRTIIDDEMEIELISPNAMTKSVLVSEYEVLSVYPTELVANFYPQLSGESHGSLH